MRHLFFILMFFCLLPLPASAASKSTWAYPVLKPVATVEDDVIRLGDIFENIDPKQAQTVVASSPPPGRRMMLESGWLSSAARSSGVWWSPTTGYERITVERLGIPISIEQIQESILQTLIIDGAPPNSEIELTSRDFQLFAPTQGGDIAVRDILMDRSRSQFTATLEVPAGGRNPQKVRITGRVFPVTEVAALSHSVRRGTVIGEGDIEWKPIRGDISRQNYVTDPGQFVGMAVKRALRTGAPLRVTDLHPPILVRKGTVVSMSLRHGNMTLTAQGKVLDNGALGDTVRVVNVQSKQTIEATVNGADRVTVTLAAPPPLAN